MSTQMTVRAGAAILVAVLCSHAIAAAQPQATAPANEGDRDPGLPTSHPGIYVAPHEVLFHVYLQHSSDTDSQYLPDDFGFPSPAGEFDGKRHTNSAVLLAAWGFSDRFVAEFRAAATRETLDKAPEDTTGMPDETRESGLGDMHARLIWRWLQESGSRPLLYLFEDLLLPHDSGKNLIGTSDLVAHTGIGVSQFHDWGTMTYRAGFLYEPGSETKIDFGEIAVEYLKRVSPKVCLLGSTSLVEGDEYYLTGQAKWDVSRKIGLNLLIQAGISSAATNQLSEVGMVYHF